MAELAEIVTCKVTSAPLKYGFVNIPSKQISAFPNVDKTIRVKAHFEPGDVSGEVSFQGKHRRLLGLSRWFKQNGAKFGDTVAVEVLQMGEYRLRLVPSQQIGGTPTQTIAQIARESDLYPHVKKALEKVIQGKDSYLEITASAARLPSEIERVIDDEAFFYLKTERNSPDLMGYVTESESPLAFDILPEDTVSRIVVEVKDEPVTVENFYQAKRYAEVFDAKYAFLISNAPFTEGLRRLLRKRGSVVHYQYSGGTRDIIYGRIDSKADKVEFEEF